MGISIKSLRKPLMTSNQAAIGGCCLIAFFACWFIYVHFWDEILRAIGGKGNLSGWVQGVGALLLIGVTLIIWQSDKYDNNLKEDKARNIDRIKFNIYISSNYHLISSVDTFIKSFSFAIKVADKRQSRNLPGFRRNCYIIKMIKPYIENTAYISSSQIIEFEARLIPDEYLHLILELRNKIQSLSILGQMVFGSDVELLDKYFFNGNEIYISSDIPSIDELEQNLAFNLDELPGLVLDLKRLISNIGDACKSAPI